MKTCKGCPHKALCTHDSTRNPTMIPPGMSVWYAPETPSWCPLAVEVAEATPDPAIDSSPKYYPDPGPPIIACGRCGQPKPHTCHYRMD